MVRLTARFPIVLVLFASLAFGRAAEIREYPVPSGSHPHDVAPAPDGSASPAGSHIARIDTGTGVSTVIEPPTRGQGARRVWSDSPNREWTSWS